MSARAEEMLREALALPIEERAKLAAELLASVDGETEAESEAAWAAEIERRVVCARAGESGATDWEVVRARLKARLDGER